MKKKYWYLFFMLLILVRGLLFLLEIKYNLYLKEVYSYIALNFVIIISGFIIFRDSNDWIKAFIYALCLILIIISLYWFSGNYNSIQSYFESPRKNNTLIIKQNYVLNKNYTEFYQSKYLIFKKKIASEAISSDATSGYIPQGLKDINVEWISEGEVCVYHSFLGDVVTINIDLSK